MTDSFLDETIAEFLTETADSLTVVDAELIKLERDPENKEVLGHIFRLVHTVKGTCGFIGLRRLEKVAHASENLLGLFRDGSLKVTPACVTLILESLDRIKEILAQLESAGAEPEGDDGPLIARLEQAAAGSDQASPADSTEALLGIEAIFSGSDAVPPATQPDQAAPIAEPSIASQSLRVSVDVIEKLMTMVSELVLTRNQLLEMVRHQDDSEFKVPLQRLSNVTAELQDGVMKTRMQPIGNAWQKLPRIVRDLSAELNKKIDLQMHGSETELDRQVLELIKDPLTHMVRNSADHGIETPAERKAAGKPEKGTINLRAYHEGGHIIIEVGDDGKGLSTERIKAKALENGIASEPELSRMNEARIHRLIFHAGLSTASQVTKVSGRGVGMDVVRSNIELIGGSVDLKSREGEGTVFTIKIPLTLAIVSALIVGVANMRFAIPQICVVELVRVAKGTDAQIERINHTPVLRLRDRLLPLVRLSEILGLSSGAVPATEAFIVVAQAGGRTFGIVVESVFDTGEIVVKPVSPLLRNIPMFSGNTILGDGSVIMIIDPNGVAAAISGEAATRSPSEEDAGDGLSTASAKVQSLLLFRAGSAEPKAVPLALVTRLEEVEVGRIESSNNRLVVQYRGRLMPLSTIDAGQVLRSAGRQPILVFSDDERTMGLVVDEIVDIVDAPLSVELRANGEGFLGTAIIRGKATEVLDVAYFVRKVAGDWVRRVAHSKQQRQVLLVDKSTFFRRLMVPQLLASGYEVVEATDMESALKLAEEGRSFDLILGDIETLGGAEEIEGRLAPSWSSIPIVHLSDESEDPERDIRQPVVQKFDSNAVLTCIRSHLEQRERAA
ncbi:MAG: chemotaxis protein CheW [Rhizomicrobium sp.]